MPGNMRVAVAVRAHRTTAKLNALVSSLHGSSEYDLYLVANETWNEVESFGVPKLSHTTMILAHFGPTRADEAHLLHCSDVIFAFFKENKPEYDFFLVIEDDVHIPGDGRLFMESILGAMRHQEQPVDFLGTRVRRAEEHWWWFKEGKREFFEVYAAFFPFIGMSARAVDFISAERIREIRNLQATGPVFCEAFVPSALKRDGDFVLRDVNELMPWSYKRETFAAGMPFLLEDAAWQTTDVRLVHPVFSAAEYLEKHFNAAKSNSNMRDFISDLEAKQKSLPSQLKAEYAARAAAHLNLDLLDRIVRLEARVGSS